MNTDHEISFAGKVKEFELAQTPIVIWQGGFISAGVNAPKEETLYRIVAWGFSSDQKHADLLTAYLQFERYGVNATGDPCWLPLVDDDAIKPETLILRALGESTMRNRS